MKNLPKVLSFFLLAWFSLFFAFLFFNLISPAYAQSMDFQPYCEEIKNDPPPNDSPDPTFREPDWGELDKTRYQTTVYDPITIQGTTDDNGNLGGKLSISNLSLPYAKDIADYLEGAFLDEGHRHANFLDFKRSRDFLDYYGPIVKLTPQRIQDRLKKGYVWALIELGQRQQDQSYKLPDINYTYTDVCGQNERTIYDLVQAWGQPDPPSLKEKPTKEDFDNWRHTWGKYWPKIPLHDPGAQWACDPFDKDSQKAQACRNQFPEWSFNQPPNMRSQGCLVFKIPDPQVASAFNHENTCLELNAQELAGSPGLQVVRLGVPDVFRLDTLSRFVQQIISPELMIKMYYCKFFGKADFCENKKGKIGDCGTSKEESFEGSLKGPSRLGECGPNDGETGSGGNPIYLYDQKGKKVDSITVNLASNGPPNTQTEKSIGFASKFPYLGLIFGKLTSSLTGAFKYFDPIKVLDDPVKYQENSTQIPAQISFSGNGVLQKPVKIWAGFLSGIKNSKDFVIDTLAPQQMKK